MINLPILFPWVEQKHGIVAKYKVEFLSLNSERTKFMLLFREEANGCKIEALGTCGAARSVYVTGGNKFYVIELFRGDKGKIEEKFPGEILAETVLPQAVSVTYRTYTPIF